MNVRETSVFNDEAQSNPTVRVRYCEVLDSEDIILADSYTADTVHGYVFTVAGEDTCQFSLPRSDRLPDSSVLDAVSEFGHQVTNVPSPQSDSEMYEDHVHVARRYASLLAEECIRREWPLLIEATARYTRKQVKNHATTIEALENPAEAIKRDGLPTVDKYPNDALEMLEMIRRIH